MYLVEVQQNKGKYGFPNILVGH